MESQQILNPLIRLREEMRRQAVGSLQENQERAEHHEALSVARQRIEQQEPTVIVKTTHGSILLVADEESTRQLVSIALGRAGYAVTLATTDKEALQGITEALPDLIILDVMVRDPDRFALLRRLP